MENYEICKNCKSFSNYGGKSHGFCMKKKKSTSERQSCASFKPDVKHQYKMECRLDRW